LVEAVMVLDRDLSDAAAIYLVVKALVQSASEDGYQAGVLGALGAVEIATQPHAGAWRASRYLNKGD
jgi:hypothetical protein